MASHKSAAKRARQTVLRTARNTAVKSQVKSAVKVFRLALPKVGTQTDHDALTQAYAKASRALRKAASRQVLHRKTAARRVSRLALAHHKATQTASPTP